MIRAKCCRLESYLYFLYLLFVLFFIIFNFWLKPRFLPGPKAFGRGPGKIRGFNPKIKINKNKTNNKYKIKWH
jgi:hypothetical protein